MSIIKQISVFNGSSWDTDNIGVNAGNVDLLSADGTAASTIAGSTNLLTGLNNILPANQLTASRALISDVSGRIGTSNISTTILNTALSGASTSTSLQSQINTLNGKIIKRDTFSGTTDVNGNVLLYPGTDRIVLSVYSGTGYNHVPFVYKSAWYARVIRTNAEGSAYTNTEVYGSYAYIENIS